MDKAIEPLAQNNSIKTKEYSDTGIHMLAEFWGANVPEDPKVLETEMINAAKSANNNPLKAAIHKFKPQGITGVLVLEESHIGIHSWPEYGYTAIDIFTCGNISCPEKAIEYFKKSFKPTKVELKTIKRGNNSENLKTKHASIISNLKIDQDKDFGQELVLNLYDCNPEPIRSKEKISECSANLL